MKVSLIVPVLKRDVLFDEAIRSIEVQTYKEIELIVIDDAKGTGAAAARNRGLDKASGEFIAFCDADDYMEPDAVANLVSASDGVDMVAGSFRKFGAFEQIVQFGPTKLDRYEVARYAKWNLMEPRRYQILSGCWAKLFRRELVGKFPSLTTAEDMAFNFDYLRLCKSVRFISGIVYNNRKHAGSLTTTFNENNKPGLFGFLEGLKYVGRFLQPYFSADEIEDALDSSKVYHAMLYAMRICNQTGKPMNEVFRMLYP